MASVIGNVNIKNFGPFEDVEIDLSRPGLTVLEGVIENADMRADSNGAGKSMVIEAVAWCIFGQCLRPKVSADDVIRKGSRGGVEVTVEIEGDKTIKVTRYRKHKVHRNEVHVWIDGDHYTPGTTTQTQGLITEMLNLDFEGFCNSVAFGARVDVQSFYAATDADRKRVLNDLLGLDLYAQASTIAKTRRADAVGRLQRATHDRDVAFSRHAEVCEDLSELDTATDIEEKERELNRLKLERYNGRNARKKKTKQLDELASEQTRRQKLLDRRIELWESKKSEIELQQVEAEKQLRKADDDQRDYNRQRLEVESRTKSVMKLEGTCPACEQPVTDAHKQHALTALSELAQDLTHKTVASDLEVKLWEEECQRLREAIPDMPEDSELDDLSDTVTELSDEIEDQTRAIELLDIKIEQMESHYSTIKGQRDGLEAKRIKRAETLENANNAIEPIELEVEDLTFWVDGFGARGLQSFLIEAELPRLNRAATGYAQRLIGPGAKVLLTATSRTKTTDQSREVLNIQAVIPRCSSTYENASKGQKRRLDLSLMLAFRDLLASRTAQPIDQLFVDELFDGMDQTGVETSCELLKELSRDRPVLLITHDPRLRGVGDYVQTVYHDGDRAAIMPQGVEKTAQSSQRTQRVKRGKTTKKR